MAFVSCALFFSLLSFFQGIKELNVYQQSEHERPVTFFKEKQRDWLRRKRTVGLFGLAKDKKKKKNQCNTEDGRRAGGGAGGGSETCLLIGPQRVLVNGSTQNKSLSNQTDCPIKGPPTIQKNKVVIVGSG